MFIKYNETNCHALPHVTQRPVTLVNKKTGAKRRVMRIDTTQSPTDIKWLRPGWNEFPKAVWDQNKDHPQIQKMLRKKKIELMSEKVTITKGGKKVTRVVGLEDEQIRLRWFDEKRALGIVKDTYDRELLQRWLDEESRSRVKRKLEKQITPLLAETQNEQDDEDEDDEEDELE